RTRLDERRIDALVDQPEGDDPRRAGEVSLDITVVDRPVVGDVTAPRRVEERRIRFQRLLRIDYRGEGFVVDRHEVRGVARGVRVVSDDHRDGVTDEPHAVERQRVASQDTARWGVRAGLDRLHHVRDFLAGEDGDHPWNRRGRIDVDTPDPRVGVWAAHDGRVQRTRKADVVDESARPGQEATIADAANRLADIATRCLILGN